MPGSGLPDGLVVYKRTPIFDETSVPSGLRREHRTKAGVWALIHVLEGRLRYRILDPMHEDVLTPAAPGIVRPEQPHEVEPLGRLRFYLEFHATRDPDGAPHTAKIL
ncbi:MAG: DUF1971 domain-containing protein [Alphaproteobacteria bacterium]